MPDFPVPIGNREIRSGDQFALAQMTLEEGFAKISSERHYWFLRGVARQSEKETRGGSAGRRGFPAGFSHCESALHWRGTARQHQARSRAQTHAAARYVTSLA